MTRHTRDSGAAHGGYDVERVRADFPILAQPMRGHRLAFLDSANSAQKPRCVIDRIEHTYEYDYANIHRGVYELSERATRLYNEARETAQRFIGAAESREIVFVRGTTEAVNLVASSYGLNHVHDGDEILISALEHHSNIVPWQLLCERTGAQLVVAPVDDAGELLVDEFARRLSPRTRLVAVTHVSNAIGTVVPVRRLVELAHQRGVPVLIDGAQAAPHVKIDVQELGCDFYAFSGHKVFGPSAIGVLYGRADLLAAMPPYQGGGEMIETVTFEKSTYRAIPERFEAGTPNIAGAIGLAAALDYLTELGHDAIAAHERELMAYATRALESIPQVRIIGRAREKVSVIAFVIEGVHPHDASSILDDSGIAVRAGHHCAQPLMERFGVPATLRVSLAIYNTREDIDQLVRGIHRTLEVLG